MIYDSRNWKEPLLKAAVWCEAVRLNDKNSDRVLVRVERELFVGFYAIRKLLDTFKVTDKTRAKTFTLKWSPPKRTVDYMNWHRIDKNFDLKVVRSETRNLRFMCDQFVHSYVFIPRLGRRGRLSGFYLSSDRMRHAKLYFIGIRQVLSAFRTVGRDNPTRMHGKRNKDTGQLEWIVK